MAQIELPRSTHCEVLNTDKGHQRAPKDTKMAVVAA